MREKIKAANFINLVLFLLINNNEIEPSKGKNKVINSEIILIEFCFQKIIY